MSQEQKQNQIKIFRKAYLRIESKEPISVFTAYAKAMGLPVARLGVVLGIGRHTVQGVLDGQQLRSKTVTKIETGTGLPRDLIESNHIKLFWRTVWTLELTNNKARLLDDEEHTIAIPKAPSSAAA